MESNLVLKWFRFSELTLDALYACLKLRSDVFVVEQECAYPDLDEVDQSAYHGLVYDGDKLIAYIRFYQKDDKNWTLGRVVVNPLYRSQKLGAHLIKEAIKQIELKEQGATVVIGAQAHLEPYYQKFGFIAYSKPYDDYGIMHIDMKYSKTK